MEETRNGTPFQWECLRSVEMILAKRGVPSSFSWVNGREESYLCAQLAYGGAKLEIYIYADEAGFFINRNWRAFEQVDYDSGQALIEALAEDLSSVLAGLERSD
jgi:hypothetical protein